MDAVENAEVAEVKRAVFRALTRLRGRPRTTGPFCWGQVRGGTGGQRKRGLFGEGKGGPSKNWPKVGQER